MIDWFVGLLLSIQDETEVKYSFTPSSQIIQVCTAHTPSHLWPFVTCDIDIDMENWNEKKKLKIWFSAIKKI